MSEVGQTGPMLEVADGHVHSEWSWDARLGSMEASCAQADRLGLPAVAFTEHVDPTPFRAGFLEEGFGPLVRDGVLTAPSLDVVAYADCVDRCRAAYPQLRILSGIEFGQPHLHQAQVAAMSNSGVFDRVLGSLHCLTDGATRAEPWALFGDRPAASVVRDYLVEVARMVSVPLPFEVLAHIDYPVRFWPAEEAPFAFEDFEEEFRHALSALARGDRALEINTRLPLNPVLLHWWRQEGGTQVTFGSDAHEPALVGAGLHEAAGVAEAAGFRRQPRPEQPWLHATT
jgi:histidinol-phosphatase (PHP family)